jgi:Fe-S cluster assembly scaffold protein SufB
MKLIDLKDILADHKDRNNEAIDIFIEEDSEIIGKFKLIQDQKLELKLNFIHNKKNIKSRIKITCAALDNSYCNIEAKLIINKGAKEVDTFLKIDGYIFGLNSTIKATPSLEIQENDVSAGHGAAVGYIDDKIMNYANSKGLANLEVENMILDSIFE